MTVETTSFLSGTKITSNGSEKSAKFIKNHKNLIICLLALILVLFCVSASILQVIFPRIRRLRKFCFYWREKWLFVLVNHVFFALHKSLINFSTHATWEIASLKIFPVSLQIWLFNRINGMQQEIDQLQTSVADMKKNIAFDDELFDDLDEFGKKVSCSRCE